jgi:type 1 fimbria pilin
MLFTDRLQIFSTALICFVALSSLAMGEDRFAVVVGAHDKLVVFSPKGERAAELSAPAIAQSVTAGDVSFQVSYGRNANQQLTAILTPSATSAADLHFNVCGKSVDADKNAVVTLIFSSNAKSVTVNAGRGGRVEVNSHRVRSSEPRP